MSGPLADKLKAKFADTVTVPENPSSPEVVYVAASAMREVCEFCRNNEATDLQALSCLTGVDYRDRIEIVYHLLSYRRKHELVLKVRLDRERPTAPSVAGVWKTADWHERECSELLGVVFEGHPDPRHLLLPDDWVGHPLRKDYVPPLDYHGMSHSRVDPLGRPAPAGSPGGEVPRAN